MSQVALNKMNAEELVELFTTITLAQDQAILELDTRKYNRLFRQMEKVQAELKSRSGDQRRALIPLLKHDNPQVRIKTAFSLLAIAPARARQALQNIVDWDEYPQLADASGMLEALDDGTYTPN